MNISVFIADDHAIVREGIKAILVKSDPNITVIGEAANGREVLEKAKTNPADIYILDISMPLLNGLEVTDKLIKMNPKNRIIILSMHDDRLSVEKAIKCGVKGYVIKENAIQEIVHAVKEVYAGNIFLCPEISRYMVQNFLGKTHSTSKKFIELTGKEKEVLQLIAEGFSSKQIAGKLHISTSTVQVHRKNLMQKLDLHKQTDLVRFALKEGIASL